MGTLRVSSDRGDMDVAAVHAVLTRMYWSEGIPLALVQRAMDGSIPFGVFDGDRQIAYARVVTDRTAFAYLADVYVLEEYRGRGVGRMLMETIDAHPDLQGLRRWVLATRDAHGLYAKFGFEPVEGSTRYMHRIDADWLRRHRSEDQE